MDERGNVMIGFIRMDPSLPLLTQVVSLSVRPAFILSWIVYKLVLFSVSQLFMPICLTVLFSAKKPTNLAADGPFSRLTIRIIILISNCQVLWSKLQKRRVHLSTVNIFRMIAESLSPLERMQTVGLTNMSRTGERHV